MKLSYDIIGVCILRESILSEISTICDISSPKLELKYVENP